MNEEMKKLYEFEAIIGEPVYTLAECVAADPRDREPVDEDAEDMYDPVEEIQERFKQSIYLCDARMLEFLRFAAEQSARRAAWEDNYTGTPFYMLWNNDFLYLFEDGGKYFLVFPDELAESFRQITEDPVFADINKKKIELKSYAAALLELYGAYEIEQFAAVWNHHHKDKINFDEAWSFLSDYAYFDSDFYFIDDYAVHDCLDKDEFHELWKETNEMDYYMPTKSVIREYAEKLHGDIKISGEKEMDEFLAEYIENDRLLKYIQSEVLWSCERLESPDEVWEILEDTGMPLDDAAVVEKFERLYNNLRGNAHIWELRGFTPHQYLSHTGESIPYFRLPKE